MKDSPRQVALASKTLGIGPCANNRRPSKVGSVLPLSPRGEAGYLDHPRCAQPVIRFSSTANSSYMTIAITAITTSPANASGIFMADPADTSR